MIATQCRAARSLLDWTQERLAEVSGVSVTAIRNFERGATTPIRANLAAIKAALETAGVEFIAADNGGVGVKLRRNEG
jgi:transcriptional regulator with XRE-family HTH domain